MADLACDVLFLAGRLGGRDEIRSLRSLVDRLDRMGHDSRVVCVGAVPEHGLTNLFECPGLGRRWRLPWAARGLGLEEAEPGRRRVLHVLGAEMADAGVEVAERWRLPYLLTVDEFPRRDARIRISRAWCRGLVTTNPELASTLTRGFGIPAGLVHTIARGIDEPSRPARGAASSGRVPVVGAAGPMVAGSGFATILNAARRVVDAGLDAEFLIAGQGEDEAELRRRADRLRIADRLTFADDLAIGLTFWDVLDVYCQTSAVPTTGRSLALALAHGVPSIASDVEGLRTLGDGPRIPPGDPVALATAISELLSDPERARAIGEAGRDAVLRDHHPDREAARLSAIYRELADLNPIAPAVAAANEPGLFGIEGTFDPASRLRSDP